MRVIFVWEEGFVPPGYLTDMNIHISLVSIIKKKEAEKVAILMVNAIENFELLN